MMSMQCEVEGTVLSSAVEILESLLNGIAQFCKCPSHFGTLTLHYPSNVTNSGTQYKKGPPEDTTCSCSCSTELNIAFDWELLQ